MARDVGRRGGEELEKQIYDLQNKHKSNISDIFKMDLANIAV